MDKRNILEPKLRWATPGGRGFGVTSASSSQAPTASQSTSRGPSHASSSSSYASASIPYTFSGPPAASQSYMSGSTSYTAPAPTAAQQEAARKQAEAFAKAAELRNILNNLEKVDDEGRRTSLLDTLCSTEDVLALPMHPNPPGIQTGDLKVNLLKHQVSPRRSTHDPLTNSLGFRVRLYNGV